MPREPHGRIVLADLLLSIAMIALGLASLKTTLPASMIGGYYRHSPVRITHQREGPLSFLELRFNLILFHGVPLLAVASLAVVALTLRPPRPSVLRPACRPGFVLCLAAVAASILAVAVQGSACWLGKVDFDLALWTILIFTIVPHAGSMVIGAWIVLALAGRGGPSAPWLDRFGYAIGTIWVLVSALESARNILEHAHVM